MLVDSLKSKVASKATLIFFEPLTLTGLRKVCFAPYLKKLVGFKILQSQVLKIRAI
jgi:hypothetical protein